MNQVSIGNILSSFTPIFLERGVPGYAATEIRIPGERRLNCSEIRSLLVACEYLGVLEHVGDDDLDFERLRQILTQSLFDLDELSADEKTLSLQLVDRFVHYHIIRADHPFDDWVCEALWEQFQSIPYVYPSAMSGAISYGLTINHMLRKCSIEY